MRHFHPEKEKTERAMLKQKQKEREHKAAERNRKLEYAILYLVTVTKFQIPGVPVPYVGQNGMFFYRFLGTVVTFKSSVVD